MTPSAHTHEIVRTSFNDYSPSGLDSYCVVCYGEHLYDSVAHHLLGLLPILRNTHPLSQRNVRILSHRLSVPCLTEPKSQVLLRWRPALLSLLAGFPVAAFVAYIVVALRFGAIQPFNDMHCDATRPIWCDDLTHSKKYLVSSYLVHRVRLLSYAGVPLLLAVPSFLLSCATAFVLFHSQQRAYGHFCFPHRDTFTLLPIRRHSRSKRCPLQPIDSFSTPALELKTYPSSDLNLPSDTTSTTHSVTPTPSFTLYAIPSPPSSLSTAPAVLTSGRVPTSPILASHNKRYHLPFSWKPATPSSFEGSRGQERGSRCTQSPSPMTFAPPSTVSSTRTSPISLPVFPGFGRRVSPPMPRGTEERDALQEEMARVVSGCEDLEEDSMGGSLRWARDSEASSFTKSELRFAREDSEGGESGPSRRRSPHDRESPQTCNERLNGQCRSRCPFDRDHMGPCARRFTTSTPQSGRLAHCLLPVAPVINADSRRVLFSD